MRKDADPTPWNTGRAMGWGAGLGAAAAGFKLLAPGFLVSWSGPHAVAAVATEIVGAALAFALLCGIAAALRNVIVGRLIGTKTR